ncbi:DUF397 domain-containing protein [Streptomyces sp. NBC_00038]|nr:DUF397 domain-containing protein [Streptomyces sp. NBC_00038]MCX5555338.1 DUF397 domain-containing protein [Streptomyces sp. NBC_00038]
MWRKSSYSGADNGCMEILTPPPRREELRSATRRCPTGR